MKSLFFFFLFAFFFLTGFSQWDRPVLFSADSIKFESPSEYIYIDTSKENLWETAVPSKSFFSSAFSGSRAILTDSARSYPPNNHSWFDFYVGIFNLEYYYPHDIFVEIRHKYDTDTGMDGGYISVSWDYGKSWQNITEDNIYPGASPSNQMLWYENNSLYTNDDTLFNGEKGFSGFSGDWVKTWFAWYLIPVKKSTTYSEPDTMIIRFIFISDDTDNYKEGWMIDDIRLYAVDVGGAIDDPESENIRIYPNPTSSGLEIELPRVFEHAEIRLFNMSGKEIKSLKFEQIKHPLLDISDLESGPYIIKLVLNQTKIISKKLYVF